VIHNPVVGAVLVWRFTRAYFDYTHEEAAPDLPCAMLVLPMLFHYPTVSVIHRMRFQSGLFKALVEYPSIKITLQRRLQEFADCSLQSIGLACSADLTYMDADRPWSRLFPRPRPRCLPKGLLFGGSELPDMESAAKRLGQWFARLDFNVLCTLLGVRF
jgi:hypothetical protein